MENNTCKHNKTVNNECLDCHWNAAIEEAAKLVQDEMGEPDDTFWIVENIRKLKK